MARDNSLGEALQSTVSLVVEFMECDSCLLYLLHADELVLCASNNPQPHTIGNVRLGLGEGLTGWVARERRLLSVSREAYLDPRFKLFTDLPEDTYEAFLSAPGIVRNRVSGVINVQHREPHFHNGGGRPKYTALVTSDGGTHWSLTPLKEYPRSIFFLNDSLGWMVTMNGLWFT